MKFVKIMGISALLIYSYITLYSMEVEEVLRELPQTEQNVEKNWKDLAEIQNNRTETRKKIASAKDTAKQETQQVARNTARELGIDIELSSLLDDLETLGLEADRQALQNAINQLIEKSNSYYAQHFNQILYKKMENLIQKTIPSESRALIRQEMITIEDKLNQLKTSERNFEQARTNYLRIRNIVQSRLPHPEKA